MNPQLRKEGSTVYFNADVGTAWLLLSHGTWVGISITLTSIAYGFLLVKTDVRTKDLSFFILAMSLVFSVFTIHLVFGTWRVNAAIKNHRAVYGDTTFIILLLLILVVIAMTLWTIVVVALH